MNQQTKRNILGAFGGIGIILFLGVFLWWSDRPKDQLPIETYSQAELSELFNDCYLPAKVTKYYQEISSANCHCITYAATHKFPNTELRKIYKLPEKDFYFRLKNIIDSCAHASGRDTVRVLNRP